VKYLCFRLALFALLPALSFAQAPDTVWTKIYGGNYFEHGSSVWQTTDGGYIITGLTESFGAGSADVWLVRTDGAGDTLWTKTYGGVGYDRGSSVQRTSDGGHILVGCTNSNGAVWLLRTDTLGDTLWTKTYGEVGYNYGHYVRQTSDDGYVIAGWIDATLDTDVWLLKTDSLGDTVWTKSYGDTLDDRGYSVQQTSDGGYILVGYTDSFGAGSSDLWLVRTDSLGDTLWTTTYGWTGAEGGIEVQQTTDGGYIIAGETNSFGAGSYDVWLLRISPEPGIEEETNRTAKRSNFGTTVISGPLLLPEGRKCKVFDITGRVVTPQKLSPGIYFIEIDNRIMQKVVKVR